MLYIIQNVISMCSIDERSPEGKYHFVQFWICFLNNLSELIYYALKLFINCDV